MKHKATKSRSEIIKEIAKLADAVTRAVWSRSGLSKEEKRELMQIQRELNIFLAKIMQKGERKNERA